jgi:putative two-component system response regulator
MLKHSILLINVFDEVADFIIEELESDYIVQVLHEYEHITEEVFRVKPDLILLAVNMPDTYGHELCQKIKNDPMLTHIPVLLISNNDDNIDEAFGLKVGAIDYIRRPIAPAVLRTRVRTYIRLNSQNYFLESEIKRRMIQLDSDYKELLDFTSRVVEYRDYETSHHVFRVGKYVYIIALDLGFSDEQAVLLKHASQLHDVGKIALTDEILLKSGKLTFEEWQLMTTHALKGHELIGDNASSLLKLASIIAAEHHERFNGEGYPHKLRGDDIHLESRIVSVCEVFDALMCKRPFKEAWPYDKVIDYIRKGSGVQFDPVVVESFLKHIDKFIDINLQLTDGKVSKDC